MGCPHFANPPRLATQNVRNNHYVIVAACTERLQDKALREAVGQAARCAVAGCGFGQQAAQIVALYKRLSG